MSAQFAELLAALMVGLALFWLVAQPLLFPGVEAPELVELPDPEETPRGQALLALKEIEFDRATGKLSDEDFTEMHARYSQRAMALLDAVEPTPATHTPASDPVEALLVQHVRDGGGFCGSCGARRTGAGRFCGQCGAAVAA